MSIESEIRLQVYTKTSVYTNLVKIPDGTPTPYSVVNKITAPRESTMQGNDGTVSALFQVSICADTYATCKDTAILAYNLCDYTSTTVAKIQLSNEKDLYDKETNLFTTVLDFTVSHYE